MGVQFENVALRKMCDGPAKRSLLQRSRSSEMKASHKMDVWLVLFLLPLLDDYYPPPIALIFNFLVLVINLVQCYIAPAVYVV